MMTILLLLALASPQSDTTTSQNSMGTHRLSASLESGDGDVAMTHHRLSGEVFHRFGAADFLRLVAGGETLSYDWSGSAARRPEELRVFRLDGTYIHAYDAHWSGIAHASTSFQFEPGAEVGRSASYGGAVGALHRFGPHLSVGAMVGAFTRIEDAPFAFIQPIVEWKPSDGWTVRTDTRDGFGLEATHVLDEGKEWAILGRFSIMKRRFRLDREAERPEGIFEDTRHSIVAGVRWQPSQNLGLSALLGTDPGQEFRIEDAKGDDAMKFETEPAPLLGVEFSYRF